MRDKYYSYLREHTLNDCLSDIIELSYTQKINILTKLKEEYDNDTICYALNTYHRSYIRRNRVRLKIIYNTLKGICKRKEN